MRVLFIAVKHFHLTLERCKKCKGKKVVAEKKRHDIDVERGMSDKQKIIMAGEGDQIVSFIST